MKLRGAFFLTLLFVSTMGVAIAADLPAGKWWRKPDVIERLKISEEQQTKLDGIFRVSASELIDLRAEVEKRSIALRGELDQPQLNRDNIHKQAQHLSDARGRLFDRELTMLIDMRAALTDAQWDQMRSMLDNMKNDMKGPMNRPRQGGRRMQPNR